MAWKYDGFTPYREIDKYRFLIGDTDENDQLLQDEEIMFILQESTDENYRMYRLLNVIIMRFAKKPTSKKLGPQSENANERLSTYKEQVAYYYKKMRKKGLSVPTYSTDTIFSKGMHPNV